MRSPVIYFCPQSANSVSFLCEEALTFLMSLELLAKQQPSAVTALYKYKHEVFKEGALTVKQKELIAVAISMLLKCDSCLEVHAEEARKQGATVDELRETMIVTMYLAGPSVMVWSPAIDKVLKSGEEAKG
jgi:AhpD family alkylhydroperoxidase